MRLGQLTRQLNIETAQAVKFLLKKGIEIEDHPNSKLEENVVAFLKAEFFKKPVEKMEVVPPVAHEPVVEVPKEAEIVVSETLALEPSVVPEEIRIEIEKNPEAIQENVTFVKSEEPVIGLPQEKTESVQATSSESSEVEKIIVLQKEEVEKLLESGEIISEIEAEAATLDESGIIKAKFHKLEGLQVLGKIELPTDPKRVKKEEQRKAKEEEIKIKQSAGKTIDGVHPTKRAKEEGEKIKADLLKAEEIAKIRIEKARIKKEKDELREQNEPKKKGKKKGKLKTVIQEKPISPEEIKKKNAREKRQRQKEKENTPKAQKSFWQSIVDFFK